eukprot:TRINITY_DN18255_c0_g1_i1.p1 TRINITY_DN18255_c0_g1~~TRINITY_DN18255_c0_g1_i1.p1  ORF type:complete len:406 (+),score=79.24 TRINITY_DN18255_c0_g1_i1:123-1340(+)
MQPGAAEPRPPPARGGAAGAAPLPSVLVYEPEARAVVPAPELAEHGPPLCCSESCSYTALLTARGVMHCAAHDPADPDLALPAPLPWPAAAVSCGHRFGVALRRGGLGVCSWGWRSGGRLGRDGGDGTPREVAGLPAGERVALLEAGGSFAMAVTSRGEAYGWGSNRFGALATGSLGVVRPEVLPVPRRIAALSDRGLRRLACGGVLAVAETLGGELLGWGALPGGKTPIPVPLPSAAGRIAFPLRSLAAGLGAAAAADAAGRLWCLWRLAGRFARAELAPSERVVQVALCATRETSSVTPVDVVIAATAEGRMWDCRKDVPCRSIAVAHPLLSLGLTLRGGCTAHVILFPARSCGLRRCRLLLLAAEHRGLLPGGQMRRDALAPFLLDEDWIFDEQPWGGAGDE